MCINQLGPYQCWKGRSYPRLCESNFASQPWKMKTKRRMAIHLSLRQIIKEVSHAWNLIFLFEKKKIKFSFTKSCHFLQTSILLLLKMKTIEGPGILVFGTIIGEIYLDLITIIVSGATHMSWKKGFVWGLTHWHLIANSTDKWVYSLHS